MVVNRTGRGKARAWLEAYLASLDAGAFTEKCVLWPFSTNGGSGGQYPQIRIAGQAISVTRYVFEHIIEGTLPSDKVLRHTCDTPRCLNPWHFIAGSHADNMADMVKRLRSASGERNGSARLTADDVRDIRQLVADVGLHHGDVSFIAEAYGVTPPTIQLIVTGKTWRTTPKGESQRA